jgi:bifunctional non-homologous end joining protein LigD
MSLEKYGKKRNFKKTSEPPPYLGRHNGVLHFVIQKHAASHLHYDFRLESHGVLKSWAVPKGVSVNPKEKRLAMEVEDHPFDYKDFEGIIPPGNYGAGTVMVWDSGEYYVDPNLSKEENEKKIEEDIKKGHLKFYLNGQKLKGLYSLIKLHGKKNQWLLIKKEDDYANKPIEHEDESVITHRTLEEIKENKKPTQKKKKELKRIPGPTTPQMPMKVVPMMATLTDAPFDKKGWIFEVKWDGYRLLAQVQKQNIRLYSRSNQTYTDHFPQIVSDLKTIGHEVLLDGEVVVVNDKGISEFQLLQNYMKNKKGQLLYCIFDILYLDQHDLHHLPLADRKSILHQLIEESDHGTLRLSGYFEDRGKDFYKVAKENGLEGVIAKNLRSTYQYGRRSKDWLKIKAIQEQEAIICGFTSPRGSRKFLGALILGLYKGKELQYIGHTGGGFDEESLKNVYDRLKPLMTKECPFKTKPKTNAPATWVKPQLVCEVKFQEWTDDGNMRQPIFLGIREDKKPQEVTQELPEKIIPQDEKPLPEKAKKSTPSKTKEAVKLKISPKVQLSNLDKVFWPKEGYTKGDIIKYYQDIADYILPYIKGRPESLKRQPNGIDDKGFFQKNLQADPPEWVHTAKVESESRDETVRYLVCDDKETLAYMNNLGCIEINPWCSSVQAPNHPDFLVLDLDPVDIDFSKVIDVALVAKDVLTKSKMEGFAKTSGGRGMHIYVPLQRKYTFELTKDFCQLLCIAIHNKLPSITSLERNPHQRKGLIYLDYLQNHYTATMATAYSLRPQPQATVSTPLEWKEVKKGLDPRDFTIRTISNRLKKKGDLWKGVLGKGIDMGKSLKILETL